ncbi:MAG: lysophospholipid acyltransferase family protein [gamma proteobacterium symbiont of Taylorina sp.]|nr:lysophospholipid acyltransferase family protein [gamma proteobacterium symbiont of Taylorina sp.]
MKSKTIIAILHLLSWLPLPLVHGLAFIIGLLLYWFPNSLRKVAAKNLQLCFPELSDNERKTLLRQSLIENCKTMLEMGTLWLWSEQRIQLLNKGVAGLEIWQAATQKGHGIIFATPHLGAWEYAGLFDQTPLTILYRPPKLTDFGAFMLKARTRTGNTMVPTTASGVKTLYKNLKKGGWAAILPDQDPDSGGIFAPFFGIQSNTMNLINKLAQRTGAEVIFVYAERLSWGRGYVMNFHACDQKEITDPNPVKAAAALNKGVEACVRNLPAQYQWTYKRFKKRPEGETKIYI